MKATKLFLPVIVTGLAAFVGAMPIPVLTGLATSNPDISARDEAGAVFDVDDLAPRGKDEGSASNKRSRDPFKPAKVLARAQGKLGTYRQNLNNAKHRLEALDSEVAGHHGPDRFSERVALLTKVGYANKILQSTEILIEETEKFMKVIEKIRENGYIPPPLPTGLERKRQSRWPTKEWEDALNAHLNGEPSTLKLERASHAQVPNEPMLAQLQCPNNAHQSDPFSHQDGRTHFMDPTQYFPMKSSANYPFHLQAQLPHHARLRHEDQALVGLMQSLPTAPSMNHPPLNPALPPDATPGLRFMRDTPEFLRGQNTNPPLFEQPQIFNPAPPPFPHQGQVPSAVDWRHSMDPTMGTLSSGGSTAQSQSHGAQHYHLVPHQVLAPPPVDSVDSSGQMRYHPNHPNHPYLPHDPNHPYQLYDPNHPYDPNQPYQPYTYQ